MTTHRHLSPDEVVARIPTSALRDICTRDPHLKHLSADLQVTGGDKENEAATLANRPPRLAKAVAVTKAAPKTAAAKDKKSVEKRSKKKKKLTGREARKRIVGEIERLAVRHLCHHHVSMAHLASAVAELGIDHAAMGNSASSRTVAAKRLREHIASLSSPPPTTTTTTTSIRSGLISFLENEASKDLVDELVVHLVPDDDDSDVGVITERSGKAKKAEAVVRALEHEAMVAFFESFSERQLHDICLAMKNEDSQGPETSSRSVLASSIIHDQPISQLVKALNANKKKTKKTHSKKLSRKKPKLLEGVSYEDVFQWYKLTELQAFARDNSLKVSGKKKELIERILDFLSNGVPATPTKKPRRSSASGKKRGKATTEGAKANPVFSEKIEALLERILPHCKAVNKPLTKGQIDQCEAELKKKKGEGVRLPDALRQLYAACNGFCVRGDWTWGICILPLIQEDEDGAGPIDNQTVTTDDFEILESMVAKMVEQGHKVEHSVTHPSWLTLAVLSEKDCLFINVDPALEDFGSIRGCDFTYDEEYDQCDNLETLLEQVVTYVERRERARAKFLADPELADEEELDELVEDLVNDEIDFKPTPGADENEDEDKDKQEDEDAMSGADDNDDDQEADE